MNHEVIKIALRWCAHRQTTFCWCARYEHRGWYACGVPHYFWTFSKWERTVKMSQTNFFVVRRKKNLALPNLFDLQHDLLSQKKEKKPKNRLFSCLDFFQDTNIHLTHKFLQNFIVCFHEEGRGGGEVESGMGWNSDRLKGKKTIL